MRTKGSCRFAPYYKVQWYDAASLCWRDVQKAHTSPESARANFIPGKQCRVMQITERGRAPIA